MASLNKLPKTTIKSKKRQGRGYGSGKGGHTVGRGAKGLKARNKVPLTFAGTKSKKSFLKRLPLKAGKGKQKSFQLKPIIVNVKHLNVLPKNSVVSLETLIKQRLVDKEAEKTGVKILGDGKLEVALKVKLPVSGPAEKKIKKAGGEVVLDEKKSKKTSPKKVKKQKREKSVKIKKKSPKK